MAERESNLEIGVVECSRGLVLLDGGGEFARFFERGAEHPFRPRVLRRQFGGFFEKVNGGRWIGSEHRQAQIQICRAHLGVERDGALVFRFRIPGPI